MESSRLEIVSDKQSHFFCFVNLRELSRDYQHYLCIISTEVQMQQLYGKIKDKCGVFCRKGRLFNEMETSGYEIIIYTSVNIHYQ